MASRLEGTRITTGISLMGTSCTWTWGERPGPMYGGPYPQSVQGYGRVPPYQAYKRPGGVPQYQHPSVQPRISEPYSNPYWDVENKEFPG